MLLLEKFLEVQGALVPPGPSPSTPRSDTQNVWRMVLQRMK